MSRFFISEGDISDNIINISGEDVKHIKKVLRLMPGDNLILCDGKGNDYMVRIEKIDQDHINTKIVTSKPNETEPPIVVTLFQGLPKSDKMDLIIQKTIELGINRIVPIITERTVVKFDNRKDIDNKISRWQRISTEAAKQSNRGIVPKIEEPLLFEDALEVSKTCDLRIIPYENEKIGTLKNIISDRNINNIAVFIGPEGGFSENEINKSIISGIKPVTLGPRILRTETAGIAVLSILMYELGDVNG
jgi:16S rRNA (uracil1498-N3)-methyltransferase